MLADWLSHEVDPTTRLQSPTYAKAESQMTNEAFSRVKIDAQLKDVGWNLTDGRSVRFEYPLQDRSKADYVL